MRKIYKIPVTNMLWSNCSSEIYYYHGKYFVIFDDDGELAIGCYINCKFTHCMIIGKVKLLKLLSYTKDGVTCMESVE